MPVLRTGLFVGAGGFLYVSWASTEAGYPIEVGLLRGLLAFMAIAFVAYLGELVVATAPPRMPTFDFADNTDEGEQDELDDEPDDEGENERAVAALTPLPMRSDRDESQAA